jgi:hypothetical protein
MWSATDPTKVPAVGAMSMYRWSLEKVDLKLHDKARQVFFLSVLGRSFTGEATMMMGKVDLLNLIAISTRKIC